MTVGAVHDAAHWNGRNLPYRPGEPLRISDRLVLHTDDEADIDPVSFEVISTKLWNVNEEHADTIRRVSGSPIVVLVNDFNTCIMTETGDAFLFAPYIQYFASASEYIIKYTLENRSTNPGSRRATCSCTTTALSPAATSRMSGSTRRCSLTTSFFAGSSAHAMSATAAAPSRAGSARARRTSTHEPPMMRAIKIADADGIRNDVEDTFLRVSRLPDLLALELRSQIAGANRATAANRRTGRPLRRRSRQVRDAKAHQRHRACRARPARASARRPVAGRRLVQRRARGRHASAQAGV